MTKTTTACNRIAALTVAALMTATTGAWAADSVCGPAPNPPTIPDDGSTATGKQMEDASNGLEEYSNAFAEFNECAINEYNETLQKWESALDGYQNKGKSQEE